MFPCIPQLPDWLGDYWMTAAWTSGQGAVAPYHPALLLGGVSELCLGLQHSWPWPAQDK